jgi:hypothetical protein
MLSIQTPDETGFRRITCRILTNGIACIHSWRET